MPWPDDWSWTDTTSLEALAALPDDVRGALYAAVMKADLDGAWQSIKRIRQHDAPLAHALAALVNEYRFDVLQRGFPESA